MKALDALHTRISSPRLTGDISEQELDSILRAGLRAPDHAQLRPWRILVIEGEARERLGELFAKAKLAIDPAIAPEVINKSRSAPLRAPVIMVIVASIREHKSVPEVEQLLSAGALTQNMLLAAYALGLGAIWRTGDMAYDLVVHNGLGLESHEKVVGFLYLGQVEGRLKSLPEQNLDDYVTRW